jgi:uncharacterized membrane protein
VNRSSVNRWSWASDRPEEHGTITLWLLGCCLMVFALGGVSLDLWRSFSERRALAATADAAALSGASAIDEELYRSTGAVALLPDVAAARARSSIRDQLDTQSLRGADVSVHGDRVTVTVRGRVEFTLLRLVGEGGFDIAVTSTATPRRSA